MVRRPCLGYSILSRRFPDDVVGMVLEFIPTHNLKDFKWKVLWYLLGPRRLPSRAIYLLAFARSCIDDTWAHNNDVMLRASILKLMANDLAVLDKSPELEASPLLKRVQEIVIWNKRLMPPTDEEIAQENPSGDLFVEKIEAPLLNPKMSYLAQGSEPIWLAGARTLDISGKRLLDLWEQVKPFIMAMPSAMVVGPAVLNATLQNPGWRSPTIDILVLECDYVASAKALASQVRPKRVVATEKLVTYIRTFGVPVRLILGQYGVVYSALGILSMHLKRDPNHRSAPMPLFVASFEALRSAATGYYGRPREDLIEEFVALDTWGFRPRPLVHVEQGKMTMPFEDDCRWIWGTYRRLPPNGNEKQRLFEGVPLVK
jgi:hypothetical protein